MTTQNVSFTNLHTVSQGYLANVKLVTPTNGGDPYYSCVIQAEYGAKRSTGDYTGTYPISRYQCTVNGLLAKRQLAELIAMYGDKSIGKTVRISIDFKIGDSRPPFLCGKTDGKADVTKVIPYIEASLLQLKRASIRESEGVWRDMEFVSQPEPESKCSTVHQTDELDGNRNATDSAESEAQNNPVSDNLEKHGDSNLSQDSASVQRSGFQDVIKIGKYSLDFEETAAALVPLGYQYVDGIGAFVKRLRKLQTAYRKNPAKLWILSDYFLVLPG